MATKQTQQKQKKDVDVFLLFDEIDNDTAKEVCGWIIGSNLLLDEEKPTYLHLIINSHGGTLASAYSIIDSIENSKIPVKTSGLGEIKSAALMIFMTGAKGHRCITDSTSIMSHQYNYGMEGKHHELKAMQKEYDLTHARMLSHYRKHTNLKDVEIRKRLLPAEDVYLTSAEAIEYHIADRVGFEF